MCWQATTMTWFKSPLVPLPPYTNGSWYQITGRTALTTPICERAKRPFSIENQWHSNMNRAPTDRIESQNQATGEGRLNISGIFTSIAASYILYLVNLDILISVIDKFLAADFEIEHPDEQRSMKPAYPLLQALDHRRDIPELLHLNPIVAMAIIEIPNWSSSPIIMLWLRWYARY